MVFGIATILVALLVPYAGGIVNVVLSIGAVTGCSLYGPPVWSLFSKRHSGKSILLITVISLLINIGFKFLFPLSRANEMLLGTLLPFGLLAAYELYEKYKGTLSCEDFIHYSNTRSSELYVNSGVTQNVFGLKVLSITLMVIGGIIMGIGSISSGSELLIILSGFSIVLAALFIHPSIRFAKSVK